MKLNRKYLFGTLAYTKKSYQDVLDEFDKGSVEKVLKILSKNNSLNLNKGIRASSFEEIEQHMEYPQNWEDFKTIFWTFVSQYYEGKDKSYLKQESYYFYCPSCHKVHRDYEFLKPITSWDNIKEKYKEQITLSKIMKFFAYRINGYSEYSAYCNQWRDTYGIILGIMFDPSKKTPNILEKAPFDTSFVFGTKNPFKDSFIPYNEFTLSKNEMPLLCCPDCGEIIELKDYPSFFAYPKNIEFKYLTRSSDWVFDNQIPYAYEIFERDSKVILSIIYHHYFPNVYGNMMIKSTNDRYIFNTKTGLSYKMCRRDMDSKEKLYEEPRLQNITYSSCFSNGEIPKECINEVISCICEKQNVAPISLQGVPSIHGRIPLDILATTNRYAKLGEGFIKLYLNNKYDIEKKDLRKFFEMQTNPEVFSKFLKKNNIKTKGLKKIFAKNPLLVSIYKQLLEIGFSNLDVIMSLLKDEKCSSLYKEFHFRNNESLKEFVEAYSSIKSEAELAKKMLEPDAISCFVDMGSIFYSCKKVWNNLSTQQKKSLFKGSLKQVHDNLCELSYTILKRGFFIPYTKEEMNYNARVGNYIFSLAKTSTELESVGRQMHICVGTYSNAALEKNTVIILMRNSSTKELAACIELSPDYKTMKQTKDYCNGLISEEKKVALVSYFHHFGIEYVSSWDGDRNHFINVPYSEKIIPNENKDEYKIFESKNDFKKIYTDKLMINGEVINIPEENIDENVPRPIFWRDDPFA